jgi:RNA polymerase sigma factor (sigma-70 family)
MRSVALAAPNVPEKMTPDRAEAWTDVRLVRECLQGNDEAWAALLEKYKRLIYSIPIKYGFSPDAASDVFQEICVELLAELPRLREPRALPKWLMEVTAHMCARIREREQRRPGAAPADADPDAVARVRDARQLTEEILLDVERDQALRDALEALSPRCRRLVEMLFFETPPRPYKQIAEELEIACGSIGFIRGRCLERLRANLHKSGFR